MPALEHEDFRCRIFSIQIYAYVNCTPNQNWACFVCDLKIINTFFEKYNMIILKQIFWETQSGFEIFVHTLGFE